MTPNKRLYSIIKKRIQRANYDLNSNDSHYNHIRKGRNANLILLILTPFLIYGITVEEILSPSITWEFARVLIVAYVIISSLISLINNQLLLQYIKNNTTEKSYKSLEMLVSYEKEDV